jgi:hypothetical protein
MRGASRGWKTIAPLLLEDDGSGPILLLVGCRITLASREAKHARRATTLVNRVGEVEDGR